MYLEECKYEIKKKKMTIDADLNDSGDYDSE